MALHGMRYRRRGSTAVIAVVSLSALLIATGVEIDYGRLVISRQKDQVIADATTMAAMLSLPRYSDATTAGNRILSVSRQSYTANFAATYTFSPSVAAPTQVRVDISEQVPSIFPGIMAAASRTTSAYAVGKIAAPGAFSAGVVPIGLQYDTTFDLTSNLLASPAPMVLKSGNGATNAVPGNYGAMDLGGSSSGASQWSSYMKTGYPGEVSVGDQVLSETGNMNGPTQQALVSDTDSRLNRAALAPYTYDTYSSFHAGNPRVVIVLLVDWTGATGSAAVPVKGFAAFWIDSVSGGQITGRFIRYTLSATGGPGWDNDDVDTSTLGLGTLDGGLTVATLSQ